MTAASTAPSTSGEPAGQAAPPLALAPAPTLPISPLIAAGSRFPVGTGDPGDPTALSPVPLRTFLMRGAEPSTHSPARPGGTPKATTGYDGTRDDDSEEFTQPDFSP